MKSKRIPDRVHVVRPPENDSYSDRDRQNTEIARILGQISDKLKRSEAERYELLAELREYRKSLRAVEDKSENVEKAYLAVHNKLQSTDSLDSENTTRQVRFEKSLKATEDKMLKAIAGQAIMDKRIRDTEDKQIMIDQRLDQSVHEQAKLGRQMDLMIQDKALMMRKVERLENIVSETQESLRANTNALLTDESIDKEQAHLSAPSWDNVKTAPITSAKEEVALPQKERALIDDGRDGNKYFNFQNIAAALLVAGGLFLGWSLSQNPRVDVLAEPTEFSGSNNAILSQGTKTFDANAQNVALTNPVPDDVLDYNDDQLLQALENNPEQLASQLNNIEPQANDAGEKAVKEEPVFEASQAPAIKNPQITPAMENFEEIAFAQDSKIERAVLAEVDGKTIAHRIQSDVSLPSSVKRLEEQAFGGNGEAQHDLAAIYTAGHGDVEQNFDQAALWFRAAADNKIANARYNLGVSYHQGLGQDRDLGRALYWYREAAKLNHAEAQYNLGIAHIEGIGTEYNPQLAAAYFERAANQGIMEAAYNLGLIHDNGLMGQTKPEEALLWYKIAAKQGSTEAQSALEQLAKNLQISLDDVDNLVDRMQLINQSVKGRPAGPAQEAVVNNNQKVSTTTAIQQPSTELVTQVQEYLMLTGTYAGPADGINGAGTQQAIRSYQAANGLDVNGQISKTLLKSMVGGAIETLKHN